jgi:hypothetical protein
VTNYSTISRRLDGGKQFLAQFGGALHIALSDLIPGPEFFAWMFPKVSPEFWNDEKSQRKFMDWVTESMRLSSLAAWYEVPPQTIKDLGGMQAIIKLSKPFPNLSLLQAPRCWPSTITP